MVSRIRPELWLDPPVRETVIRGVLRPAWLLLALLVVPFALGASVPLRLQALPLAASVLAVGLPHGAVDHLALPRVRDRHPTWTAIARVFVLYGVLGGAYASVWFVAPVWAFVLFIALTWFHWGQGDLYALRAFVDSAHVDGRLASALVVVVRGGLPMLVPLVAFPDWYHRVADALVSLFVSGGLGRASWVFGATARTGIGAAFALVVLAHFALGYFRAGGASRGWRVDAFETLLLGTYFTVVPPLFAIGVYFCAWHSLRHVVRLVVLSADSRVSLRAGRLRPALASFAVEATPLTLGAVALLAVLALVVPQRPGATMDLVALYLVLIAVLTLPHVAVVTVMDRAQGVWRG